MMRKENTIAKSKRSSEGSLPRTPTGLDGPYSKMNRSMSSTQEYSSETMRSTNLKQLNNRLATYVEKVRMIQQATDVYDSISRKSQGSGHQLEEMKSHYEVEINDWRVKYEEILTQLNKSKIDANNLKQDNKQLNSNLSEKAAMLRERDNALGSMEAEINELFSKLNLLQSEKGKLAEKETILGKEVDKYRLEMDTARKGLDREKMRSGELEAKLRSLDQELGFKIQVMEKELAEERKKNTFDISAIDLKLKGEYEARLKGELKKLRKMYEEHTEKAKNEYMTVHSRKLAELQELLNRERSSNNGAAIELQDVLARVEEYKRIIAELERVKLELNQSVKHLDQNLKEQGATFRAQMTSKDQEITAMQEQLKYDRSEYESLLKLNNDLDLEIEIYRSIIDAELDRMAKSGEAGNILKGMKISKKGSDSSSSSSDSDESKRRFSRSTSSMDIVDGRLGVSRQQRTTTTHIKKTSASRF